MEIIFMEPECNALEAVSLIRLLSPAARKEASP
jgi:hypothetical protein